MIRFLIALSLLAMGYISYAQNVYIPDANFKKALIEEGVDTNKEKSTINIYPNPSDDIISIEIENINNATIEIYNVSGKLVFSKELKAKVEKIDLSGFSRGMYLVKVSQEQDVKVGKVVVK
jgi:hypothetical protein